VTKTLTAVCDRIHYAIGLGALALITGDIGSGKSTALRYVVGGFHPSEYRILPVTATSGSILELYRQILAELGVENAGASRAKMTQFEQDSKPFLPIILAGQANLIDNLSYRNSQPLASRVVARCHLSGIDQNTMQDYLLHHLKIAGVKHMLFDDAAVTAIHQGSGGLFRKANHLARGALVAAAKEQETVVSAEHVRRAATELF
jgi:type II secretory pathway predicted ATPase ExeA